MIIPLKYCVLEEEGGAGGGSLELCRAMNFSAEILILRHSIPIGGDTSSTCYHSTHLIVERLYYDKAGMTDLDFAFCSVWQVAGGGLQHCKRASLRSSDGSSWPLLLGSHKQPEHSTVILPQRRRSGALAFLTGLLRFGRPRHNRSVQALPAPVAAPADELNRAQSRAQVVSQAQGEQQVLIGSVRLPASMAHK